MIRLVSTEVLLNVFMVNTLTWVALHQQNVLNYVSGFDIILFIPVHQTITLVSVTILIDTDELLLFGIALLLKPGTVPGCSEFDIHIYLSLLYNPFLFV